ncbi:MAG: hypothetical protein ACKVVP_22565 [Chloroflexota bacterium]
MIDPAVLVLWLAIGTLVGWLAGRYLYGDRLVDDLLSGAFGSIAGGAVANTLLRDVIGGPYGVAGFAIAIALALIVTVRILPRHRLT